MKVCKIRLTLFLSIILNASSYAGELRSENHGADAGPFIMTTGWSYHPKDNAELQDRVYENWVSTSALESAVVISARIVDDGKLYDVKVQTSSGDAQLDADCVQAVMGASASGVSRIGEGCSKEIHFRFESIANPLQGSNGISRYFDAHPSDKKNHIAFYRIPIDVLNRYPKLFTKDELLTDGNVGIITVYSDTPGLPWWGVDRLREVYQVTWTKFFLSHPSATKQQILTLRDKLPFDERPFLAH